MDYFHISDAETEVLKGKVISQRCDESLSPPPPPTSVPFRLSKQLPLGLVKAVPSRPVCGCFLLHGPLCCRPTPLASALRWNPEGPMFVPAPCSVSLRHWPPGHNSRWAGAAKSCLPLVWLLPYSFRAHWAGLICSQTDLCTFQPG